MITPLPKLMVAPNGARATRRDHPALPVTLPQILATAETCFQAGADGLHLHIRDGDQRHVLDAAAYREALSELAALVPEMVVQVTTEAAGRYSAAEQRQLVRDLAPRLVSVALREMLSDGDLAAAQRLYRDCADQRIGVQHILYEPAHLVWLSEVLPEPLFRNPSLQVIFVLGNYTGRNASASELEGFLAEMTALEISPDWAACAFGPEETACLRAAHLAGGKLRVGFENNWVDAAGSIAPDNAARVAEITAILRDAGPLAPRS
ncbi:MAG: 3-keto-5-aminohexanoate cleavage protein [Pseudomonadota bacterium]